MIAYDVWLSLSDLLHLVWKSLGPSMLLQMALCSFLWLSNSPLHICTIFFNHFSVKGYLDYFHVFTMVNSASMNIGVHVYPFKLWFSLDIWSGIAGSYDSSISTFKEISVLFFIVVVSIYIPTNSVGGFSFLHNLSSIYL